MLNMHDDAFMFEIYALAGISAEQSIVMAQEVKFPSVVQTWIPDINRSDFKIDENSRRPIYYLDGIDHLADQQVVAGR